MPPAVLLEPLLVPPLLVLGVAMDCKKYDTKSNQIGCLPPILYFFAAKLITVKTLLVRPEKNKYIFEKVELLE